MMAKKKNPLKPIFDQLGEMINIFYAADKEALEADLPEGIDGRVEAMRAVIDALQKSYYEALKMEGLNEKEVMDEILNNPHYLSPEDLKLIMQGVQLRTEALAIAHALDKKLKATPTLQRRGKIEKFKEKSLRKRDIRRKKGWRRL